MKRTPDLSFDSSWRLDDEEDSPLFHPPSSPKRIRQQQQPNKSVRFAPVNEVSYRYLSKEDLSNAWYKPQDWQRFKAECRETVSAITKANGDLSCLDSGVYCIYGLEDYIAACLYRRSSRQRLIVRQVVLVQEWQRKKGVEDEAALKIAYMRLSNKYRSRALRRAHSTADTRKNNTRHAS